MKGFSIISHIFLELDMQKSELMYKYKLNHS